MHTFGAQPFVTSDDNSRNLGVMAWLAWGEGWHNNHHAFPYSAAFGLRWFEFDPGFIFIRALEALGTGLERQGAERGEDRAAYAAASRATRRPTSKRAEHHRPARAGR